MLHLERPIVALDVETTGLDVERDRIIELCIFRFEPCSDLARQARPMHRLDTLVRSVEAVPGHIQDLTGIQTEELQEAPPEEVVLERAAPLLEGADVIGYAAGPFDLAMLFRVFERRSRPMPLPHDFALLDPRALFKQREPERSHTLEEAARFYLPDEEMPGEARGDSNVHAEKPHRAAFDVDLTLRVLAAQLRAYGLGGTAAEVAAVIWGDRIDRHGQFRRGTGGTVLVGQGACEGERLARVLLRDPHYAEQLRAEATAEVRMYLALFEQALEKCRQPSPPPATAPR